MEVRFTPDQPTLKGRERAAQASPPSNLPVRRSFELCKHHQALLSGPWMTKGHDPNSKWGLLTQRNDARRASRSTVSGWSKVTVALCETTSADGFACANNGAALSPRHEPATACCFGCGGSRKPRMPSVPLNFISAS